MKFSPLFCTLQFMSLHFSISAPVLGITDPFWNIINPLQPMNIVKNMEHKKMNCWNRFRHCNQALHVCVGVCSQGMVRENTHWGHCNAVSLFPCKGV